MVEGKGPPPGSDHAREWLKSGLPERPGGDPRLNPRGALQTVTITCFPYGLGVDIDYGDLDLLAESGPGLDLFLGLGEGWVLTLCALGTVGLTVAFYWFILSNPSPTLQICVVSMLGIVPLLIGTLLLLGAREAKSDISGFNAFSKIEHIIAFADGLQFVNKRPASSSMGMNFANHSFSTIAWSNLEAIELVGNEADFDAAKVSFTGPHGSWVVSLLAIHTRENWSSLTRAIKHYAPHAVIDDSIAAALTLSSNNTSFTEIWLESLTTPPDENYLVPIAPGDELQAGRFAVQDILGAGGQGHAYLAYDAGSGDSVVLKEYLLPTHTSALVRERALKAVEAEIVLLSRISHPQIVRLIDSFVERNRAFLVFNRIAGVNLRQHIEEKGKLTPDAVLQLAQLMVDILAYLHSSNPPIIHRDFTPDNLIIDDAGHLTLVDFTIAEPAGPGMGRPPAGKPAYMPPEQYGGDTVEQSDIYAMGGTLYFALTGQDPEPLMQLFPAEGGRGTVGEQTLAGIIQRCTAQDFRERFKSCRDVQQSLQQVEQAKPSTG